MAELHTEGPWLATGPDMFGDYNIVLADRSNDCRAVAAVVSNMRDPLEVAANAMLTKAGPTMLKTLRYLAEKWESDDWATDQEEMARVVRDTIAAATIQPSDITRGEC